MIATSRIEGGRDQLALFSLAEYLGVAPSVVQLLVERDGLPVLRTGGRWSFQRVLVNRWLDLCMSGWHDAELQSLAGRHWRHGVTLTGALKPANVFLDLRLSGAADCFRQVVGALHLPPNVHRSRVLDRLLARERMCSTALDHGFAVPHTARDGARFVKEHAVAFVRARHPIPFAPNGKELTDLFLFVFAADDLAHLRLLARATRLARSLALADALRTASDAEKVRQLLSGEEERVFGPGAERP